MPSYDCQNSELVKIAKDILKSARESSFSNITPISTSEIKLIEDALTEYNNDCKICVNQGANDYKCHQAAEKKLIRAMPFMRKNIYRWSQTGTS